MRATLELSELEVIASNLLEQHKEFEYLGNEIERTKNDLREFPRKSAGEKKFYALIGMEWEEPKIEDKLKQLIEKKDAVGKVIGEENEKIVVALTEKKLIVPLDPNPTINEGRSFYRYRANSSYPKAIQELGHILGLEVPLKVDDVVIDYDKIIVAENEANYAMMKIVDAFEKISNTVALKLKEKPTSWKLGY